ncbi:endolytic transglycosylase MltG [uncultured Amnibacterium sp.]|uniref:endolytic transglycosylase MltG n=1 Tax=uncultured Amnibacterium sp. TaxID=1631851 RepID=UPI0035CB7D64
MLPLMVFVVAGGGLLGLAYQAYPDQVKTAFGWKDDYAGAGSGSVRIVIRPGQVGGDVADTLAAAGVTKTRQAFFGLLLRTRPEPKLMPGTYRLAGHQSAAHALAQLEDPKNRIIASVAIPEGSTVAQILQLTSENTGVPLADLKAAARDRTALGVPKAAPNLEGWLFPATYDFQPGTTAPRMLAAMTKRMRQSLDAQHVAPADRLRVLTLAGLVQKEGNGTDDAKVARVFLNRIAKKIPLQSDATVSYGAGGTTVLPTEREYAQKNGYNTYRKAGLPIGPISNPGDVAIKAALHPAAGKWLYFVTVNLATGETVFSTTGAQHEKAAAQFRAWLAKHPSYNN